MCFNFLTLPYEHIIKIVPTYLLRNWLLCTTRDCSVYMDSYLDSLEQKKKKKTRSQVSLDRCNKTFTKFLFNLKVKRIITFLIVITPRWIFLYAYSSLGSRHNWYLGHASTRSGPTMENSQGYILCISIIPPPAPIRDLFLTTVGGWQIRSWVGASIHV